MIKKGKNVTFGDKDEDEDNDEDNEPEGEAIDDDGNKFEVVINNSKLGISSDAEGCEETQVPME